MKGITLWQPHAGLMARRNPATGQAWKTIETRSWCPPKGWTGDLLIYAAAR